VTESLNAKEYKSKFRYAESCLYNYQLNLSKIKTLSEKLESLEQGSSVKAQSYESMSFGGEGSRLRKGLRAWRHAGQNLFIIIRAEVFCERHVDADSAKNASQRRDVEILASEIS